MFIFYTAASSNLISFFFNDTPTPEIYPLSLHDALPISLVSLLGSGTRRAEASVLISSPAGPAAVTPMLPNLRELATSSVVAGNGRSTLRLTESTQEVRRDRESTRLNSRHSPISFAGFCF